MSDGDTLPARCEPPDAYEPVKVRFQGINAPERKQPFGERAQQAVAELKFQKEGRCCITRAWDETSLNPRRSYATATV